MAMAGRMPGGGGWGIGGLAMGLVTAAQLTLATMVIILHVPMTGQLVVAAGGSAILSIVLIALSPMPRSAKAGLIALLCASGMALVSMQDLFGMRAINRKVAAATGGDGRDGAPPEAMAAPALPAAPATGGRVTIRTAAASDDAGFAPALSQAIDARLTRPETGNLRITGAADVTADSAGVAARPAYSVTWSVADRGLPRWCGRIATATPNRAAAVGDLATIIARSADRIADGAASCS